MDDLDKNGCETLEEAARGDFPPRFVTVVGSRVTGDRATVWLVTNDEPPFELYTVYCQRRNGRWYGGGGHNGFGDDPPDEVRAEGRRRGWS